MTEQNVKNNISQPKQGKLIVIEGGEGVGKTTNSQFIQDYLKTKKIDFIHTREPGGTPLAEEIRDMLLKNRDEPVAAMSELLLVFAARAQHVEHVIRPALERGAWVLSDRFVDASYVYQGVARDIGSELVSNLEKVVLGTFKADQVIVLDASLKTSQARAKARGELDRFESENELFHERVRQAYLQRANSDPSRYSVVNAEQSIEKVKKDLTEVLDRQLVSYMNDV